MISALFVEPQGVYSSIETVDMWPESRDARAFAGPGPVVAHPPCARWCRLAESVFARTRKEEHRPGNDGGCFASALASVRRCGGVLEHPSQSKAWRAYGLTAPTVVGWTQTAAREWVCEVWQSAYGHLAPKRTWLLYVGDRAPFELDWRRLPGSHAVSGDAVKRRAQGDAARPRLTGRQNLATPPAFARELLRLAAWSILPPR